MRTNINLEARRQEQSTVNDDTAAILDMSTNLLYQTAKHTRKLMDVETQVRYPYPLDSSLWICSWVLEQTEI